MSFTGLSKNAPIFFFSCVRLHRLIWGVLYVKHCHGSHPSEDPDLKCDTQLQLRLLFPTCSAPPGRKFSHLVPSLLLKVVTFNAPDGLWSLSSNHDHHLNTTKTAVPIINKWKGYGSIIVFLLQLSVGALLCPAVETFSVCTLGQQAGVLIRVRAVFIRALWSAGSKWYFMASIR